MQTVAFIGLGIMGRPMALNLIRAGHPLVAVNRSPGPLQALEAQGAKVAPTPAAAARDAQVVITMLGDTPDVEQVYFGPQGVLSATRAGMLLIDMSTVDPAIARRIAEAARDAGAGALDAPVSGGEAGARAGELSIMVGGDEAAFAQALPILEVLGKRVVRIGPSGAGQVAKACNQIIVAVTLEAVGEALTLAKRAGVDPEVVREALLGGFAQSRVLEVHGLRMLQRQFQPGFRAELHRKDLRIALAAGRSAQAPLPATALVHELLTALMARGGAGLDHSALVTVLEALSGQSDPVG